MQISHILKIPVFRMILSKRLPRKTSKFGYMETVPQTDTGGQVEKTKANGWVLPKELDKKALVS